MSQDAPRRTARSTLRIAAAVVATISAVLAVILIVFADASTAQRLGTVLALWTLLLGSFAVIRVHDADAEGAAAGAARSEAIAQEALAQLAAIREETNRAATDAGREAAELEAMSQRVALEVRRSVDLERQAAAAAQREFLMQLELMLRKQLESTLERELASMRDEVSALRAEVLDQLGGQLRLERIETTRLIGSDVEALQREVSQLASMRRALQGSLDQDEPITTIAAADARVVNHAETAAEQSHGNGETSPPRPARPAEAAESPVETDAAPPAETQPVQPEPRAETQPVQPEPPAETQPELRAESDAAPSAEGQPEPPGVSDAAPQVEADAVSPAETQAVSPAETQAVQPEPPADDEPAINRRLAPLFADLPSLSRFRDTSVSRAQDDAYSGRRRRAGAQPVAEADERGAPSSAGPRPAGARDGGPDAEAPAQEADAPSSGGRRRRADDQSSDVLSRLLGR